MSDPKRSAGGLKRPLEPALDELAAVLRALHAAYARDLGASLSQLLRTAVQVRLAHVDRLDFRRFADGLASPTCSIFVVSAAMTDRMVLDISPSIFYPIIDRLLGGGQEPSPVVRRPLTEIEQRLVPRIAHPCLRELERAWANVVDLGLSIERIETNPRTAGIVSPEVSFTRIEFEVAIDTARGAISLGIPWPALQSLRDKLLDGASPDGASELAAGESAAKDAKGMPPVRLAVHLEHSKISRRDLAELRPGDIITTSQDVDSRWTVTLDGVPRFHARPGALNGRKAVQIERPIEPQSE